MSAFMSLVILCGVLAATSPGVFLRVELNRLAFGGEFAGPGVVRLGLEDCALLGRRGVIYVEGAGAFRVHVTDCQQEAHRIAQPMSGRGLLGVAMAEKEIVS